MPWVGLLAAAMFLVGFRRMAWRAPVLIYGAVYVAVVFAWPYYTSRLWMPIVPLIVLSAVTAARSSRRTSVRNIGRAYFLWFILTGAAALAFITRASLAGENFRRVYGSNGGLAAPGHQDSLHEARVRVIIRRFDAGNPAWRTLDGTVPGATAESP
jgi:Na+/H+-dicarboxylate symporter